MKDHIVSREFSSPEHVRKVKHLTRRERAKEWDPPELLPIDYREACLYHQVLSERRRMLNDPDHHLPAI